MSNNSNGNGKALALALTIANLALAGFNIAGWNTQKETRDIVIELRANQKAMVEQMQEVRSQNQRLETRLAEHERETAKLSMSPDRQAYGPSVKGN